METTYTASTLAALNARVGRVAEFLALIALIVLASTALFKVSNANAALGVLLLATLLKAQDAWLTLRREPLFWCALLFAAYVLTYALLWPPPLPSDWDSPLRIAGHYIKGTFLPALLVGYWLYQRPGLMAPLVLLLPLGLALRVLMRLEPSDVASLAAGTMRATFGDSAVHFGVWSIVVLLCGIWALTRGLQRYGFHLRASPLFFYGLLVMAIGVAGALFSHARTSWGLAILLVPAFWLLLVVPFAPRRHRAGIAMAVIAAAVGLALVAWWTVPELLQTRWAQMQDALTVALSGNWANAPLDSPGYRLHMWREAWLAWMERPWFGSGPGSQVIFLSHPEEPAIAQFHQFHNNLLSMLVEFGVAGGLFFLLAFGLPGYYALSAWWRGGPERNIYLLALFALLTMLGAAMGDNIFSSYRGPFLMALFAGIALAGQLEYRHGCRQPFEVQRYG